MLEKRRQGRPKKNDGVSGRDRIIEGTHSYLRSRPKLSLTRTEIAEGCGVTPALLSYYFKDRKSLLAAVTKPLTKAYSQRLRAITSGSQTSVDEIRGVIRLLIEMNADDAFLLDYLLQDVGLADLDNDDRASTDLFRLTISRLLDQLMEGGLWRAGDPTTTRLCLWGVCRILGEALSAQSKLAEPGTFNRDDAISAHVDFVYGMFSRADDRKGAVDQAGLHRDGLDGEHSRQPPMKSLRKPSPTGLAER